MGETKIFKGRKNLVGIRISKMFEGYDSPFLGTVVRHYPDVDLYHIQYDDGDSEDMTENDIVEHMVVPQPESMILDKCELLGMRICKIFDGVKVSGKIVGYALSSGLYQVVYNDGDREEMTEEEIKENAVSVITNNIQEVSREKQLPESEEIQLPPIPCYPDIETEKYSAQADVDVSSEDIAQLLEELEATDEAEAMDVSITPEVTIEGFRGEFSTEADPSQPLKPFEKKSLAYDCVRKAISFFLSCSATARTITEEQKQFLNNPDLRARKALIRFVESGGLSYLNELLEHWLHGSSTNGQFVFVVLQVLAVIPGVSVDAVKKSGIGRTIKKISKCTVPDGDFSSPLAKTRDMAKWVVKSWRGALANMAKNDNISSVSTKTKEKGIKRDSSTSQSNGNSNNSSSVGSNLSGNGNPSKSIDHLNNLMGSKKKIKASKELSSSTPKKEDTLGEILGKKVGKASNSLRPDWIDRANAVKNSRFRVSTPSSKKLFKAGELMVLNEASVPTETPLSSKVEQSIRDIDGKVIRHHGVVNNKDNNDEDGSNGRRVTFGIECKVPFDKDAPSHELDLPWKLLQDRRSKWAEASSSSTSLRNGSRRFLTPGPRTNVPKPILKKDKSQKCKI